MSRCHELKVWVLAQAEKSHSTVLWDRRWTGSIKKKKGGWVGGLGGVRSAQIPYTVNLEEKGRDTSGGCRLLQAATPPQLLVRPPLRTLEGHRPEQCWQTRRTAFLTLSTCSRFSSLPWSWFLSNRAKSLSWVTAPRVSLRLTYSDFGPKKQKRVQIDYI